MRTDGDLEHLVQQRIQDSLALKEALLQDAEVIHRLVEVARRIVECLNCGGKVLLFGNGGSAADAQHLAAELVGRYRLERQGLPAVALTVNTSLLTAIGNDYGFGDIFARQLQALGAPGDVAIAICTSGNSHSVLRGVEAARAKELVTVGFTGKIGGQLKALVDYCICMPSEETPRVQEGHILIGHILCEIVERELFP